MAKQENEYKNIHLSPIVRKLGVLLLTIIALATLGLLFVGFIGEEPELQSLLNSALSFLYLTLYFSVLLLAKNRALYIRRNWWLLFAALPLNFVQDPEGAMYFVVAFVGIAQFLLRIYLLLRVSRRLIPRTYSLLVITALASTIVISSTLFYSVEHELNDKVDTYFDSFWWAFVTGTTVGYGDITPVTTSGRWIAIVLMVVGIGVFGFVTGAVSSKLTSRAKQIAEEYDQKPLE